MGSDPTGEVFQALLVGAAIGILEQFMTDVIGAMIAGIPLDENFSSVGTYAAAAFSGALSAIPGGGALRAGVEIVGTAYVQTCVDIAFGAYEHKDPNSNILGQSIEGGFTTWAGDKVASLADKIGSSYKGSNKLIKKAINVAENVTRVAGKYMSNIFDILFSK